MRTGSRGVLAAVDRRGDGSANIEIAEAEGTASVFTFGLRIEEVAELRRSGTYSPLDISNAQLRLREVLEQIAGGHFSPDDPQSMPCSTTAIATWSSPISKTAGAPSVMLTRSGTTTRGHGARCSISRMGAFTSDRSISEYAQ